MTLTFDPEDGELGSNGIQVTPEQFILTCRVASMILEEAKKEFSPKFPMKYAIEIYGNLPKLIEYLITRAEEMYHMEFYSVDGKKVFEIRGLSGGVVNRNIVYLIVR